MNRLPPELLTYIISHLPVNQILKCKQVNSEWSSVIDDNIRLKNLVITNENLAFPKWSLTYQPVNCYDWIKQFYATEDQLIFKNLNQLYIEANLVEFKLSDKLNFLKQLKRLEIIDMEVKEKNLIINLPNLTHLALVNLKFQKISLNTPNLSHLRVSDYSTGLNFKYPSSIKVLQLKRYDSKVMKLSNLEYLFCEKIEDIEKDFLIKMPNLKEIHFNQDHCYRSKNIVELLKKQNNELERDLKVYYYGMNLIKLPDIRLDSGRFLGCEKTTDFLCQNYDKLAEIVHFIYSVAYDVLEYRLISIPIDFTSKFVNINSVSVEKKLNDLGQFIEFLKGYRNLKRLNLRNSSFKQKFIDLLPELLPNLDSLSISDKKISYDFEPILKLKNLSYFSTNQKLEDHDFIYNLVKKTSYIQIYFSHHDEYLAITCENGNYSFGPSIEEPVEYDDFEEMFEAFRNSNFYEHQFSEVETEDEEMDSNDSTDESSDDSNDESIYELRNMQSNDLNIINQSSSSNDELEIDYRPKRKVQKKSN